MLSFAGLKGCPGCAQGENENEAEKTRQNMVD
jgi:hypothetical protein